jgi:hypothetical protein
VRARVRDYPVLQVRGFVMAGGCNAHGVSGSAGIGHHVVESMFEKEPSPYVRSLSPDRYTSSLSLTNACSVCVGPHSRLRAPANQVRRWFVGLGQGREAGSPHPRDLLPHPQAVSPSCPLSTSAPTSSCTYVHIYMIVTHWDSGGV